MASFSHSNAKRQSHSPESDRPDNWVVLSDFRPGIYSNSGRSLGQVGVPAPLGAAQETLTYRCVALSGGGLGPLPRRISKTRPIPTPDSYGSVLDGYWITGFFSQGQFTLGTGGVGNPDYQDQLFIGYDYLYAGSPNHHKHRLYRIRAFSDDSTDSVRTADSTSVNPPPSVYRPMTFASTRMSVTGPDYTDPGQPVVVASWDIPGTLAAGDLYNVSFPDPSNPTAIGTYLFFAGSNARVLGHQGRVVWLVNSDYSIGPSGGLGTDEQIAFTDPANSNQQPGLQNEVFVQEYPTGYGAWGSISAGELFLVKNNGGGLIVLGDIKNPSITRLPGVASTGGSCQNRAASTPYGLFYATRESGAYVWRGSDTSQKITNNLRDDALFQDTLLPLFLNYYCSWESWGDWVVATNCFLYNIDTKSWWKLDDPQTVPILHWSKSGINRYLYGAVGGPLSNTTPTAIYVWDRTLAATSWSWMGHPIPQSLDRVLNITEISILAQGVGSVGVTLYANDGSSRSESFTLTTNQRPARHWMRTSCISDVISVQITADGSGNNAPVVYEVALGYKEFEYAV